MSDGYCEKHDREKYHTGGQVYECPECVAEWREEHPEEEWADDATRDDAMHMIDRPDLAKTEAPEL